MHAHGAIINMLGCCNLEWVATSLYGSMLVSTHTYGMLPTINHKKQNPRRYSLRTTAGDIFMFAPYLSYLYSSSKLVMLFRLMARVEALCSRAEVAGCKMPMAPSTISVLLKPMIKR